MKTQVTFRSKKFPPYEGEIEGMNPGRWGKRLAEYLAHNFAALGIQTGEILAEDWGWYIPIKNDGFRLAVCCGHLDGDDDEFVCFTDPGTPMIRKWFRKVDVTMQLDRVLSALATVLSSDPEINNLQWQASSSNEAAHMEQ